ncbi:odorant binding protein 25 [Tribolium castaneum]|uniref:Odorant binding protein 25 n=2 Tax=Tribolium castaneum TaxID=7070 RepID=D6WNH2_TRICA|nr:odorant binding protein 25 [Tribolium castaneum]
MPLKNLIILIVCPLFVFAKVDIPPDLQAEIDGYYDICYKQIGLTKDDLKAYKIGDRDPKIMCFMKCVFVEAKWMDENENLQYDYIKNTIHHSIRHITLPELENCGKKAEGDKCEKSFSFFNCMNKAEPEDWVLIQ